MTPIKKRVARELAESWDHHGRNIIIEIEPPGLVSFREKGKRRKWTSTARWLMQMVIEQEVKRAKGKKRKAKRGLLTI